MPRPVAEDSGEALVFTVSRNLALATDTVVNLAPSDLPGVPAKIRIPGGATVVRLRVTPRADTVPEPDETVAITLLPGEGYTLDASAVAKGVLRNDDRP